MTTSVRPAAPGVAGRPTTDNRALLSQGALYTVATAAPVLTLLLVTPLVTRILGAEQYGRVALAAALVQIGQVVVGLGLPTAILRHVSIERTGARGASGLVLASVWLSGLVACLAVVTAPLWAAPLGLMDVLGGLIVFPLVSSAALSIFTAAQSLVRGLQAVRTFVIQSVFLAAGAPLAGLIALVLVDGTAAAFLVGLLVGQTLVTGATVVLLLRSVPPGLNPGELRDALRIALPTVPHSLALISATSLLTVLVGAALGAVQAAEMQLSLIVGSMPFLLLSSFNNSWATRIYAVAAETRAHAVESTTRFVSVLVLALSVGTAAVAPVVMRWLVPPSLDPDELARIAATVAAGAPIMALYLANMHLVLASGKTAGLAIATPLALVCALGGCWALFEGLGRDSLVAIGAGVPLFYLLEAGFVSRIRRSAGERTLSLRFPIALTVFGSGTCLAIALVPPAAWLRVSVCLVTAIVGGCLVASELRAERS